MSDEKVPASQRSIHIGGLMRCCLLTLRESTEETVVGSVLQCRYTEDSNHSMVVGPDGEWRWNRPGEPFDFQDATGEDLRDLY